LFFNQFSKRGASCSKKPALDIPQDKKPRRCASDLINCVYVALWLMLIKIEVNKWDSLALIAAASPGLEKQGFFSRSFC
jgi:hypothetical protein